MIGRKLKHQAEFCKVFLFDYMLNFFTLEDLWKFVVACNYVYVYMGTMAAFHKILNLFFPFKINLKHIKFPSINNLGIVVCHCDMIQGSTGSLTL